MQTQTPDVPDTTMTHTTDAYMGGTVAAVRVAPDVQLAFGQVYGSLFYSTEQSSLRSVLITSAGRGDGSSTTAAGIALMGADAQRDVTIALVDLNFRTPALHHMLRVPQSPGVSEIISGQVHLAGGCHRAGFENLFVFPVGGEPTSGLGAIRSAGLQQMLSDLAANFDHVIIDAPPASMYPEAQMLSRSVDGVVLVCRANRTRREAVAEAKKRIELGQGKLVGMVLNRRRFAIPGWLYNSI